MLAMKSHGSELIFQELQTITIINLQGSNGDSNKCVSGSSTGCSEIQTAGLSKKTLNTLNIPTKSLVTYGDNFAL